MKFGIGLATCREGWDLPPEFAGPEDLINLTQEAENLGIDFVWGSDFISLTPAHKKRLPAIPNWYEILISLAAISSVTSKIQLGIGVVVLPFRDSVILAKQVATLDAFSNGRVMFGVGLGAMREEFERIAPAKLGIHRGRLLEEQLEALILLFTKDDATFKGNYVQFDGVTLYPRPIQSPIPIYISGHSGEIFNRVVKWGKGIVTGRNTIEGVKDTIAKLHMCAEDANRDPASIDVIVNGAMCLANRREQALKKFPESYAGRRFLTAQPGSGTKSRSTVEDLTHIDFIGSPEDVAGRIVELKEAGVTHLAAQSVACNDLDEFREQMQIFASEVMPLVK